MLRRTVEYWGLIWKDVIRNNIKVTEVPEVVEERRLQWDGLVESKDLKERKKITGGEGKFWYLILPAYLFVAIVGTFL